MKMILIIRFRSIKKMDVRIFWSIYRWITERISFWLYLHVNSIRNKFELFSAQVKGNIDVLMISETKVHTPYRSDCDSKSGGIILFVREDIQSNVLD